METRLAVSNCRYHDPMMYTAPGNTALLSIISQLPGNTPLTAGFKDAQESAQHSQYLPVVNETHAKDAGPPRGNESWQPDPRTQPTNDIVGRQLKDTVA